MDERTDREVELVVTGGLHAGARRKLRRNDLLLIGGTDACDVVLADGGIARRHCLVGLRGGTARVEALDASLRVDGELLPAGAQTVLAPGAELRLGEATLHLRVPSPESGECAAAPAPAAPAPRASAIAIGIALLVLAAVLTMTPRTPAPAARAPVASTAIETLRGIDGIEELALADGDGGPRVVGRVRDAQLRARIAAALPGAAIDVVVGDQLAADVRQALRKFDLLADTRYLGGGVVEIVSAARDQDAIRRALGAERTRGNLAGLSEVALSAVDAVPAPGAAPPALDDGKRIVAVVDGADPHARTADGSTYGIGARLPDGGLVVGIDRGVLRVRYGDELREIEIDQTVSGRPLAMR